MYPNNYCNPCNPAPTPEVTPAPSCDGTPCEEILLTECTLYNGPAIECFNITEDVIEEGLTMNDLIQIIAQAMCTCTTPTFTTETTQTSITITITNALTPADYYELEYSISGQAQFLSVPTVPGQTVIVIEDLDCFTDYDIHVEKVCIYPNTKSAIASATISTNAC